MITLALRYWRALAVLALAAALVWGYLWWRDVQRGIGEATASARYETALREQKDEARALLDAATERVRNAEKLASAAGAAQNLKDRENEQTIDGLRDELRHARRLRDPYATLARCGGSGASAGATNTSPAGAGAADAAEADGLLSEELSGLLRDRAHEADTVNAAYASALQHLGTLEGLLAACRPVK